MDKTERRVILPDGTHAIEVEYKHYGGSETQVTYGYYDPATNLEINEFDYETDYWGRIEGVEVV